MSCSDEATKNPNDKQMPGHPLAPEPVAPADYDGHADGSAGDAGLPDDGSAGLEDAPVGGLEETRKSDDGLGHVNEDEDEPGLRAARRMNTADLANTEYDQTSGNR